MHQPLNKYANDLPFLLETNLEQRMAANPLWQSGLEWGQPRPGHPEGAVAFHIQDVLNNVDRFFSNSNNRSRLRLIALTHDTFKYKAAHSVSGERQKSHGYFARKFAEQYISDIGILEVIELHDEAYKAYLLKSRHQGHRLAKRQAKDLIVRLGNNIELFMQFYLCDSRTIGKSNSHYNWFVKLIPGYA